MRLSKFSEATGVHGCVDADIYCNAIRDILAFSLKLGNNSWVYCNALWNFASVLLDSPLWILNFIAFLISSDLCSERGPSWRILKPTSTQNLCQSSPTRNPRMKSGAKSDSIKYAHLMGYMDRYTPERNGIHRR